MCNIRATERFTTNDNVHSEEELVEINRVIKVISQLDQIDENNELLFPYFQMISEFLEKYNDIRIVDYLKEQNYVFMIYLLKSQNSYDLKYTLLSIFTFITQQADVNLANFLINAGFIDCIYNLLQTENVIQIKSYIITITENLFEFLPINMQSIIIDSFFGMIQTITPNDELFKDFINLFYFIVTYYKSFTNEQISSIFLLISNFITVETVKPKIFFLIVKLIENNNSLYTLFLTNEFVGIFNEALQSSNDKIIYGCLLCLEIIFYYNSDVAFVNSINFPLIISFLQTKPEKIVVNSLNIISNGCIVSNELTCLCFNLNILEILNGLFHVGTFDVKNEAVYCFSQIIPRNDIELRVNLLKSDFFMEVIESLSCLKYLTQKSIVKNLFFTLKKSENTKSHDELCARLNESEIYEYAIQLRSNMLMVYMDQIIEMLEKFTSE